MATETPKPAPANVVPCRKCGGTDFVTQLRKVQVDIGWKMTQIHAIAPANMCTKCGNLTVTLNATIGDLANLVPDPDAVERLKQAAMAGVEGQRGAAKKGTRKKATKKKAAKRKPSKKRGK